jgi:hypothetical protein
MLLSVLHKKALTHRSAEFLVLRPNPTMAGGSHAQFTGAMSMLLRLVMNSPLPGIAWGYLDIVVRRAALASRPL